MYIYVLSVGAVQVNLCPAYVFFESCEACSKLWRRPLPSFILAIFYPPLK